MKFNFLLFFVFFFVLKSYSQQASKLLFTIDDEPIYTEEFMAVYNKNLSVVPNSEKNEIENYLQLFVDYKLKVQAAKDLGLDTVQSFKKELEQYKEKLILPYLKDEEVTKKLVWEAYVRLQKEVNVSHILIFLKPEVNSKDTIEVYNKLIEARNLILDGERFSDVAKKYSQDPSVQQNGGKLGYFTALQMVYPFENMSYSTPVNDVSMPFRTKFGYHILKVNDSRRSLGEVEVAHIMLKEKSNNVESKIDSVYKLISNKQAKFEDVAKQISEDRATASKGGRLKKFSAGQMEDVFSDVAFSLQNIGDISKPFKTKSGWHIIELIKKYPLESFEDIEAKLTQKVERDDRSALIGRSVIERLINEYTIEVNIVALNQFKLEDWNTESENFNGNLLEIQDRNIHQQKFIDFLRKTRKSPIEAAFEEFKEQEVLKYYKDNIHLTNKEFSQIFNEFKEGLLLFEMLEKKIWEKSKDSIGLKKYFEANKLEKYANMQLETAKGKVISDYQNYLEEEWVKELHEKYKVKFNKAEKNKILQAK